MSQEPNLDFVNYLHRVYESRNNEELGAIYDEWAKTYEQDTSENWERRDPNVGAEVFAKYVPLNAKILDVGADTGLVGQLLAEVGYTDISGIDLSEGMLAQARSKVIYKELRQMVLGQRLDYPTDYFDAAISIGVFTQGHARPDSFDEIVRIVRPGGKITFGLRPDVYEELGFKEKQTELETEAKWKLVERSEPFGGAGFSLLGTRQPDILNEIWVYEVTS